jgi:hypothetical protein
MSRSRWSPSCKISRPLPRGPLRFPRSAPRTRALPVAAVRRLSCSCPSPPGRRRERQGSSKRTRPRSLPTGALVICSPFVTIGCADSLPPPRRGGRWSSKASNTCTCGNYPRRSARRQSAKFRRVSPPLSLRATTWIQGRPERPTPVHRPNGPPGCAPAIMRLRIASMLSRIAPSLARRNRSGP